MPNHANTTIRILYQPKNDFPSQDGPFCYYFSLMRSMQFQNDSYLEKIPSYCTDIIEAIKRQYLENSRHIDENNQTDTIADHDDLIDDMLNGYLTDAIIQKLNLLEDNVSIQTVEDFIDNYSTTYAMGLLLNFKLINDANILKMTVENYADILRKHGPITFDGEFGLSMNTLPQPIKVTSWNQQISIYPVDNLLQNENNKVQHTILMIGLQKSPTEEIYYIDPNYPDIILSLSFKMFKERVLPQGNKLICQPENNIVPLVDTFLINKQLDLKFIGMNETQSSPFFMKLNSTPKHYQNNTEEQPQVKKLKTTL